MKPGWLKADILLNLDSEEEDSLYIGCSGGKDTTAKFNFKQENVPADSAAYEIKVAGLQGGHSGLEIHTGRGNAVKILNRLLWKASDKFNLRIAKIEGGNKHNAIPREAFAMVTIPKNKEKDFLSIAQEYNKTVKAELATNEPNLSVSLETIDLPAKVIDLDTQKRVLNTLYAIPHGVITMSPDIAGLVETSTNLAVILTEGNAFQNCNKPKKLCCFRE